ncbi:MAG: adenosylmethionine decarboxylase [Deltaproteobacteria bacterium]|nr:adenosylmethionine decarboxylase [Deltaproteobacteria bacterium]
MDSNKFHTEGTLIAMDLWGLSFETLNHPLLLSDLAKQAAEKAGMRVLAISIVPFRPQGLSLAVILGESHLTIHTAPEYGYAAVDVFTCGKGNPLMAVQYLIENLKPKEIRVKEFQRGVRVPSVKDRIEISLQLKGAELASR